VIDHRNGLGKDSELVGGPTVPNVFVSKNRFVKLVATTGVVSRALDVPTAVIPK
jgi:hypothetical protein